MYLCTFIYSLCLADPHLVPSCKYLLFIRVGESVESALSELSAIFSALSAFFINFQQKIPYFDVSRQKRVLFSLALTGSPCGSLWLLMALSLSLSGSVWLSVTPILAPSSSNLLSQAFTGSLWLLLDLSLALYGSL